jgi:putative component of membrane protein insertase Oxa1/YidC/SpoIIIJ protein YidD
LRIGRNVYYAVLGLAALTGFLPAAHYDPLSVAGRWAIDVYRGNFSALQGRAICNFNPSCSQFSKQALDRYGFLPGVLMTADRLERCNPYAPAYLGTYYQGVTNGRMNDPIENHAPEQGPYPLTADRYPPESETGVRSASGERSAAGDFPQLAFADYLFREHDYARAISEYRRFLFLDSDPRLQRYARYMIAESYLHARDYPAAEAAFRRANDIESYQLSYLGMARSLLGEAHYDAARHYAAAVHDPALLVPAALVQARAWYQKFNFRSGSAVMAKLPQDTLLSSLASWDGHDIPARSRPLSTALSAVLPGLGQAYSDRVWDGFYSFLVVGTAGMASWYYWTQHEQQDPTYIRFGFCAALGTVFYLGNVYGANIAARDYNQFQKQTYLKRIESVLDRAEEPLDYGQILGINKE